MDDDLNNKDQVVVASRARGGAYLGLLVGKLLKNWCCDVSSSRQLCF